MSEQVQSYEERMKWFHEARFGMFIHWGLYAILGRGEWVMHNERIPAAEYARLAKRFKDSLKGLRPQMRGAKYVRMDTRFRLKPSSKEAGQRLGPLRLTRKTFAFDNVRAVVLIDGVERRLKLDELIKIGDSWRLLDAPTLMP